MNAAPDRTALMQQEAEEKAKRLKRAADDVMDGGHSISSASANRMVDYDALRAELERRGWKPIRLRQNNSRSRAKQLPPARSDNQS